jgi:hypothetical protein
MRLWELACKAFFKPPSTSIQTLTNGLVPCRHFFILAIPNRLSLDRAASLESSIKTRESFYSFHHQVLFFTSISKYPSIIVRWLLALVESNFESIDILALGAQPGLDPGVLHGLVCPADALVFQEADKPESGDITMASITVPGGVTATDVVPGAIDTVPRIGGSSGDIEQ